jgi:hypothetical protein
MKPELTISDLEVILTSFKYSKNRISDYSYPSLQPGGAQKMRATRLSEIEDVEVKIRNLKRLLS